MIKITFFAIIITIVRRTMVICTKVKKFKIEVTKELESFIIESTVILLLLIIKFYDKKERNRI